MNKVILAIALAFSTQANAAELEIQAFGGMQSLPHSIVTGRTINGPVDARIGWQGKSFAPPPYYGVRAIWWRESGIGFGMELTHDKAYAPESEMAAHQFDRLEFTDGHNIITANIAKRWVNKWGAYTPFVGAGIGIALPHVDIQPTGGAHTFGYQLTGPALRLGAGVSRQITETWSLFAEYEFTVSDNKAKLDDGGTIETTLVTNAINVGVGYKF